MDDKPESKGVGGGPPHQVAAGVEDAPKLEPLPVWFFVGIIFIVYGVIILVTGFSEIQHPPGTVLARELHPAIWWGAVIAGLGILFVATTGPWTRKHASAKP